MKIDNNQQNLTFKANMLVRGTRDIEAAKRVAKPVIENARGIMGYGFTTNGNSVLVVDLATRQGKRAQYAYGNMRSSFKSGDQIVQRKGEFHSKLRVAARDAEPMDFPA